MAVSLILIAPVNDEAKKHNGQLPGMGGVFNIVNFQLYHYAGNNPVKYTDPDGKQTKDSKKVYLGKGNIIGYGYISTTMGGSLRQSKNTLFKNFVFVNMTVVPEDKVNSQISEFEKESGKNFSNRPNARVDKNTEFSRALSSDEITYDDLQFSKDTGGYIYFSDDKGADTFTGTRENSFLFVSDKVDIYKDTETGTIYLVNSKKEELPLE